MYKIMIVEDDNALCKNMVVSLCGVFLCGTYLNKPTRESMDIISKIWE